MWDLWYFHRVEDDKIKENLLCGFIKINRECGWMSKCQVEISGVIRNMDFLSDVPDKVDLAAYINNGKEYEYVILENVSLRNGYGQIAAIIKDEELEEKGINWNKVNGFCLMSDGVVCAVAPKDNEGCQFEVSKAKEITKEQEKLPSIRVETEEIEEIDSLEEVVAQKPKELPTFLEVFLNMQGELVDAFETDDVYDCMEVTLEQLKVLLQATNNDSIDVENNSFLRHGFYTFNHILVGRLMDDENGLFVGVPGLYGNRERFLASMFGFHNFRKSHRSDCRNQYFGYWY